MTAQERAETTAPSPVSTRRSSGGAEQAQVIVVGAGPGGSATAYYLARAGIDVLLLEKAAFPREKVCGDGLTPRGVAQLLRMGIDTSPQAGWIRNKGLRILGGGMRLQLPWPELATFPDYGVVRPRDDLDDLLARTAVKAGARLRERTHVLGPVVDEASGEVVGVRARDVDDDGRKVGPERTYRAPVVVAADGNSARLALGLGLQRRTDRPMGVAVRTYYRSPRHDDDWLESWLELWDRSGERDVLLPGYGWVFGLGDGRSNVGLGILNTSKAFGELDYKAMLHRWVAGMPPEWEFSEATMTGPVRGAALPMGFNRTPAYYRGVLLVGDAAGTVNPFNGEGIAYAMESAYLAAEVITSALARTTPSGRRRALAGYPQALRTALGGYYTLGRGFVQLIGNPTVMKLATRHGLPHPVLMRFVHKLLAGLSDPSGGDAMDRVIAAMTRLTPAR